MAVAIGVQLGERQVRMFTTVDATEPARFADQVEAEGGVCGEPYAHTFGYPMPVETVFVQYRLPKGAKPAGMLGQEAASSAASEADR
jgi:hypothetical protein